MVDIVTEITTATAAVAGGLTDIIPIALAIAIVPFGARLGWRFLKGLAK